MLRRLAPFALGLAACAPMPPTDWSRADQDVFGSLQHAPELLQPRLQHDGSVDAAELRLRDGMEVRCGGYELSNLPSLEQAWRSGSIPRYGVVGQVGGTNLTGLSLETRTGEAGEMQVLAVARALHPYPFELRFTGVADGEERDFGRVRSERWGPGVYYAKAEAPLDGNRLAGLTGLRAAVIEDDSGWTGQAYASIRPVW